MYDALTKKHRRGVSVALCWTEEELKMLRLFDEEVEREDEKVQRKREAQKRYREKHRDYYIAYSRAYHAEHKEELRAKRKEYYARNREQEKEASRMRRFKKEEQ